MRKKQFFSAGLALALLPGTCTNLVGDLTPEAVPLKSVQFLFQTTDPPPDDEPVDTPIGTQGST